MVHVTGRWVVLPLAIISNSPKRSQSQQFHIAAEKLANDLSDWYHPTSLQAQRHVVLNSPFVAGSTSTQATAGAGHGGSRKNGVGHLLQKQLEAYPPGKGHISHLAKGKIIDSKVPAGTGYVVSSPEGNANEFYANWMLGLWLVIRN